MGKVLPFTPPAPWLQEYVLLRLALHATIRRRGAKLVPIKEAHRG